MPSVRTELMIAVDDVVASSLWYQKLLGCKSDHGGSEFDRLVYDKGVLLLLHHRGAPEHPSLSANGSTIDGLVIYFRVEGINSFYERAMTMAARHLTPVKHNAISHQQEFSLLDPDGYFITVCE